MIFAFTTTILGVTLGTWIAATSAVMMAVGAGVSIYSGYQANSAASESARMQESAAQAAANAQQAAANAQAQQLQDQAELATMQAALEDKKAGVEQQKGEIEQRRRMIQLSYDIGNSYSQWAGNGLLVDGGNDSLGQLITAQAREAGQDVGIIKSNTENAVWEHSMNKSMSLISASNLQGQAASASAVGGLNANATLLSGEAQAYATRQADITALYQGWGSGLAALGSAGFASYGAFKPAKPA